MQALIPGSYSTIPEGLRRHNIPSITGSVRRLRSGSEASNRAHGAASILLVTPQAARALSSHKTPAPSYPARFRLTAFIATLSPQRERALGMLAGSVRRVGRRLDHDLSRHVRMQRAEIFVPARFSEGEGEAVVGVERLRLEHPR